MDADQSPILRFKTAIRRHDISRPVKCALADGLLSPLVTFFDFGCGHGEDIDLLGAQGISGKGWDPVFRPNEPVSEADVVNLGYVLNVIEDPAERSSTLRHAWRIARRLLVVSTLVRIPGRGNAFTEFGDGVLTSRGTFQKFFEQAELREYLEAELKTEAIPATVGVFYLFKDDAHRQQFLASRVRRGPAVPRQRVSERRFEEHREVLHPFMNTLALLGRLPDPEEFRQCPEIISRFGSLKRAFALVRRVTGEDAWDTIRRRRTEDLLVFLALARFRKRPKLSGYPPTMQRDFRAFFGTYMKACTQADLLLFRAGDAAAIDEACQRSTVGKLLPNALYLHRSALEHVEPLLRIYEGCARSFLGEIEGANIIKLHRFSGKVSYLVYPDFENDPHPALFRSVKLSLRARQLECYDYTRSENPPILHRKERFLHPDHASFQHFADLTRQEEENGLLDDSRMIGNRDGWEARLRERGFAVQGHVLVSLPSAPK
ncbi:MAG: DNA phosphorothioation-associated putative methyltransferase [Planctomycetes bacterium]|nr:DNA phosphorothioation-associated putative methyltransferase [Planctomycetota bacterium]